MANLITCFRILASAALLLCQPLSSAFFVLYIAAGISDMVDGPVARRTGAAGDFGAKLDTVADFFFLAVCLYKLLPVLNVPVWLRVWIALIALIKAVNIVFGFVVQKRFVALHTFMNKAAGAMLFLLPLTFPYIGLKYTSVVVCAVVTFAAVQEGRFICMGRRE
jgi:CDP-diacylglycerol--glycerol-3-phosphate 3-phosphatidyltransferase